MNLIKLDSDRIVNRSFFFSVSLCLSLYFQWPLTDISKSLRDAASLPFFIFILLSSLFMTECNYYLKLRWEKAGTLKKVTPAIDETIWMIALIFMLLSTGLLLKIIGVNDISPVTNLILINLVAPVACSYAASVYIRARIDISALLEAQKTAHAKDKIDLKLDIIGAKKHVKKHIRMAIPAIPAFLTYSIVMLTSLNAVVAYKLFLATHDRSKAIDSFIGSMSANFGNGISALSILILLVFSLQAGQFCLIGHKIRSKLTPNSATKKHIKSDFGIGLMTLQSGFLLPPILLLGELPTSLVGAAAIMTLSALTASAVYSLLWNDKFVNNAPTA